VAATWIVKLLIAYLALGSLFAIAFATLGVSRVDPTAKGSTIGFRLIIVPGAAALWPILLAKWIRKGRGRP
jgi:hypothetical protein